MRVSSDEIINGILINGYDYENQCWVRNGHVENCGHPPAMRCGCFGRAHAGKVHQEVN